MVQTTCERNGFRRHIYRSHIIPDRPGAYVSLLVDNTTDPKNPRTLLVTNAISQKGERIVVSTIAIDWEFHQDLLINIIVYITEGLPTIAFIDNSEQQHGDFDFLLTGARLSKISHSLYKHPADISPDMYAIHDTYVFSPDWDEQTVESFINLVTERESQVARYRRKHIKVNFFRKLSNVLLLSQYSNFSSIDLVVRNSITWLNSKFEEKMWGGSFWITYDVVLMMIDLDVDVSHFTPFIYRDIVRHYALGSYDAVVGATCGLFELTALLYYKAPSALAGTNFDKAEINQMFDWVMENKSTISEYDLQTITLTSNRILQYAGDSDIFESHYPELLTLQERGG